MREREGRLNRRSPGGGRPPVVYTNGVPHFNIGGSNIRRAGGYRTYAPQYSYNNYGYPYMGYYNGPRSPDWKYAPQSKLRRHTVTEGETPLTIAQQYGISEEDLAQANAAVYSYIPGAVLNVPDSEKYSLWQTLQKVGGIYGRTFQNAYRGTLDSLRSIVGMGPVNYEYAPGKSPYGPGQVGVEDGGAGTFDYTVGRGDTPEQARARQGMFLSAQELHTAITELNKGNWPSHISATMADALGLTDYLAGIGYVKKGLFWYATVPVEELGFGGTEEQGGEGGGGGGGGWGRGWGGGGWGGGGGGGGGWGGGGGGGGGWGGGGGGAGGERFAYSIDQGGSYPRGEAGAAYLPQSLGYVHWRL